MIIRWVCEKDNKKWMYPIEKCIYCKRPVKKIVSKNAKIIGITKVNVPSPSHPIIPYYVILLEDSYGNRMPKKTMREYKIGERYEVKKAENSGAVVITKIKYDLFEYLNDSISLLDNYEISSSDKVMITPTIIEPAYPNQAVNTDPELLDAVISYLKETGMSDIVVGTQSFPGNELDDAAKKSGILEVCNEHDMELVDLGKGKFAEIGVDGSRFKIAKEAIERKIINVPVMKTHSQLGVSGAMENMLRVASLETQKEIYDNGVDKMLPLLVKGIGEFLTIGDATTGMQGQGPTVLGEPAFMNKLFLSKDPVALDAVFAESIMLKQPQYIKEAAAIGVGKGDIKDIEVVGNEIEAIKVKLKHAESDATAHPKIMLIDGKADPGTFSNVLRLSSKLVGIMGHELHIALGKHISENMVKGKDRIIAYGTDAIERLKELDVNVAVEIHENVDAIEKIMIVKSLLENQEKKNFGLKDKIKSKFASLGAKVMR